MKSRGVKKRAKPARRNIILRLCVLAVSATAMVALLNMQAEIDKRGMQVEVMRQRNETQRMLNKELRRQIEAGLDDETVERIARERFDYAYPDEIIFIDISGS